MKEGNQINSKSIKLEIQKQSILLQRRQNIQEAVFLTYRIVYAKTEHLQNSRRPEGLYILLHTLCDSSPWGSSQNSGHYTAERTPS